MAAVKGHEFTLVRAEGPWVWDKAGRRYLDGTAGLWYANLGHCRSEIATAVMQQLHELDAYSIFGDYANEPALELAERIAALAPLPGSRVFLGSGGGDAIEAAAKIARRFHVERGEPSRMHLIGRAHGYHGTHGIGTGIGGIDANAEGFGDLVAATSTVPYADAEALEAEIVRVGADRVAAFFCEPVIGAGGVLLPPEGYIESVGAICRRHGVLFVADCVIAAFGRLGTWLGIDRWPVKPDLITLAKGISNGTLPVGAVIVAPQVAEPFFELRPTPYLRHGVTYAGHPTCCAAANAALDLYQRDGVIERGRLLERPLREALSSLADHPLVGELRAGLGFLAGIDLAEDVRAYDPRAIGLWQKACRDAGVLVRPLGTGIAVSPPLTVGLREIDMLADGILSGLSALDRGLRRPGTRH